MIKKSLLLPVICGIFCLLVASCRKTDYKSSNTVTPVEDKTNLNALFASLHPTPEVLNVTAGVYSEVRASQGTLLKFYPNTFKDKTGAVIDSGTVQISLIEIYGPGAGVASRSASLTGNLILQTKGQIYITAAKGSQEVFVNKYGVGFLSPAHSTEPMSLYYGYIDTDDSLTKWTRVGNMTGTAVQGTVLDSMNVYLVDTTGSHVDTSHIYRNYNMFDSVSALKWVGCQFPMAITTPLTNLFVTPTDASFNATNTAVFVVLSDMSSVIPVTAYNTSTKTFALNTGYEIPSDTRVHLVTLGFKNGKIYLDVQMNVTLDIGMKFAPVMREYTVNDIYNLLSTL